VIPDKKPEIEVKPPEKKELPGWFQRLAADAGFDVSTRVAEAVIEKVGGSLNDLSNAVQILDIVKTGSKRVNMDDIKYLPLSSEVEVWDILDRLWKGEASEAIKILRRLESQGDAPEAVLGGLAFGVRQLYLARGRPLQYWEQKRFGHAVGVLNDRQFRRVFLFLGEADLRIKTTNEPGFDILEELLLKISAMRGGVR
jgi:DNA polymerase III delta subunit